MVILLKYEKPRSELGGKYFLALFEWHSQLLITNQPTQCSGLPKWGGGEARGQAMGGESAMRSVCEQTRRPRPPEAQMAVPRLRLDPLFSSLPLIPNPPTPPSLDPRFLVCLTPLSDPLCLNCLECFVLGDHAYLSCLSSFTSPFLFPLWSSVSSAKCMCHTRSPMTWSNSNLPNLRASHILFLYLVEIFSSFISFDIFFTNLHLILFERNSENDPCRRS